ncbi:MAG: vitamin K epoxide reductase family protein [Actinomycetia bacterium]|nr:vitamin K epoxide reductase family protein [Actinomycetes bacterium]
MSVETAAEPERRFIPTYRYRGTWIETLISSLLGLVASFVLSMDAIILAQDGDAELSCNINEKISCGAVGVSWQAELLGFPNAFLGLIAEPVIITIAVASIAGVLFPRWFMLGAQVVSSIGFVFALWLFHQSYFEIGRLCPYCLLITGTTTLIFFAFTRVNVLEGNFGTGIRDRFGTAFRVYHADIITAVLLIAVIAAMVVFRYL